MVKRGLDVFVSLIGLILLSPVFVILALLIKVDSRGPVFYFQQRIGKDHRPFKLFKFRTMKVDADKLRAITVGSRDPRITRVGYYLRKFKVDETAQLMNVLIGDMSLVGPRPELKKFVDLYDAEQQAVLTVRPGITDPASIAFRNENELLEGKDDPIGYYIQEIMPKKLELNQKYIREQTFWLDVKIIFQTLFSIFR
jgi:lipopolysaccharide/colanic/teichoic acid biosynthesis glycosyltransferase